MSVGCMLTRHRFDPTLHARGVYLLHLLSSVRLFVCLSVCFGDAPSFRRKNWSNC